MSILAPSHRVVSGEGSDAALKLMRQEAAVGLMVGLMRILPLCAVLLPLTLLVPASAFAYGEAISVSPSSGPVGQTVIVTGTGWRDHARLGWDVPIWIGFGNEVARGHPDANGEFSVSFAIPLNPPPEEFVNGKLRISAIIGNGGGALAFYTVTLGQAQLPPEIVRVETFREGQLVFFRVFYTDPNNDAEGFGFVGVNGSPWAREIHPFSSPSYGRVHPGRIEYPFNHACGTPTQYESDVAVWIYDRTGLTSQVVTVHLTCSAPMLSGWYSNSGPAIIFESVVISAWWKSYVYQYPGTAALSWYAEVIYLNQGNQTLPVNCVGRTNPSLVKEHMRGTANAGAVAAKETFCSRYPNFTGFLKPAEAHYEWAIFDTVPWPGGEVALEWGPYGFSPWVDPWYSPYAPEIPTPGDVEHIVTLENQMKRLVDLVGDVVSGSKGACDIFGCGRLKFPVDLLNNIFTVFNLIVAIPQEVTLGDKLKTLNQEIREHGRDSPQVCQAAKQVYEATRNLHSTLLGLVPPLGFIFPLPVESGTQCRG